MRIILSMNGAEIPIDDIDTATISATHIEVKSKDGRRFHEYNNEYAHRLGMLLIAATRARNEN